MQRAARSLQPGFDEDAYRLATTIAFGPYEPNPVWVMDICKTSDDSCHLLEIGGFSFADLYKCIMAEVVAAVSAAAMAAWEQARAQETDGA